MSELPEYIQIMRVYNFLGAHLTSLKNDCSHTVYIKGNSVALVIKYIKGLCLEYGIRTH